MRLLLFTGKGGAGKTTIAAATAVHAARCGLRTLVLSAGPAHSLGDALGMPLSCAPCLVAPGLYAQQVDPRARAERSLDQLQHHLIGALEQLGADPQACAELTELPGAQDVLALMEVRDQISDGDWDLVVMDCAPAAQTLALLALPEVLTAHLDRLLPMEQRIDRIVGLHRTDRARSGEPIPGDRVVEAAERFATELASLDDVLHAPGTSVRLVMTPETVVLSQTRRSWTALALHGVCVDEVIANRIFSGDAADEGGNGDPWRHSWAQAHELVLAQAAASFAPVPLRRAGFAAAEPVGVQALAGLATSMLGPPSASAGEALLAAPDLPGPFEVDRDQEGFVLRVPVPLADRSELELGRRGDDLVVTVGGQRRTVVLPSALRRCDVDSAALRDGALAIRFVPDPAQWRPM